MCGIAGIISFSEKGKTFHSKIKNAVACLRKRGPDNSGIYNHNNVSLGHARLSIIDTSSAGDQPFTDTSGRYTIIFNGEFFNYKEHRKELEQKGISFKSETDTEVLLHLYINEKEKCLEKVNGFFALAIYDNVEESLFIARDRFGIKPLLIYRDEDKLIFASETKSLLAFDIPKIIDQASLFTYLQLNYIPAPHSIFSDVRKITPGTFIRIQNSKVEEKEYYKIPFSPGNYQNISYDSAQQKLKELLEDSVKLRLIADVPLGSFLSGGIDSSIIAALAAKHTKHLKTFSIGYKDEPLFDETHYANLVARMHGTDHTVFSLTNDDLYSALFNVLDYIDEPFADSSALPVNILSMHTRKHVTVALSGDGADEMFAGYNKHMAEYKARNIGIAEQLVSAGSELWNILPKSRNSALGKRILQLQKFSEGVKMSSKERYWKWAGTRGEKSAAALLLLNNTKGFNNRKEEILKNISGNNDLNDILFTDMSLVLPNDMLTKVDMMSMANSLEVRVPFLDYRVVNFAFSLPSTFKIDNKNRKKILKDTFQDLLPAKLYTRKKQGFEVPLLKWFKTSLKDTIEELLNENFIHSQNIFNYSAIQKLKQKLFSADPGDAAAQTWNLIVFQYWYKKYMM